MKTAFVMTSLCYWQSLLAIPLILLFGIDGRWNWLTIVMFAIYAIMWRHISGQCKSGELDKIIAELLESEQS